MIRNSRERELTSKPKGDDERSSTSSSKQWPAGLKNPRIVRVSRAFGGKDRHSKVSTVRGLRDRRVRLSVQTAIQLYDLQDRLGLNQPSKVVDWLLNAAQHEIDKLPPLQLPMGNSTELSNPLFISREATQDQNENRKTLGDADVAEDLVRLHNSTFWKTEALQRIRGGAQLNESGIKKDGIQDLSVQIAAHHPSLSSLLNDAMPQSYYSHWNPSNAYPTCLGIHSVPDQVPSTSVPSSWRPMPRYTTASTDFDSKMFNYLQMASSTSQDTPSNSLMSFYSSLASKHHPSQDHHEG